MQKNDEQCHRLEKALTLWQATHSKVDHGKKFHGFLPLVAVLLAGIAATGSAYLLYGEKAESGNFMMAASVFKDFAEENPAIAVFLGLNEEGAGDANDGTKASAED